MYTLLCRPDGGIVDDCIFYKRADDDFYVIVNASNTAKDLDWMREHASVDWSRRGRLRRDRADRGPGPAAPSRWSTRLGPAARSPPMPRFAFVDAEVAGVACMAARTGYTGEDGFELACPTRTR